MTPTHEKPLTFLEAVRRIEAHTQEIRREGLAGFERAEAAYAEVRELRAVLQARLADLRRRTG
jgi:hypothetical protein